MNHQAAGRRWVAVVVSLAVVAGVATPSAAQPGAKLVGQLQERIVALEGAVAALSAALETLTRCLRVEGTTELVVEGCNLHVRSGLGATDTTNGLGNLIVGYNEPLPGTDPERTGSHNLVIGPQHVYASYGGLVAGRANRLLAPHASVTGGRGNFVTVDGWYGSVTGGGGNYAEGVEAVASGGRNNHATGLAAVVSGGFANIASGVLATVSGGEANEAAGPEATVSGGVGLTADEYGEHLPP